MIRIAQALTCAGFLIAAQAAVVEFKIENRSEVAGGRSFGAVGPYERVTGKVRFAIDPKRALNSRIVDIGRARTNPDGLVEFTADVYLLRPVELARGNRTVLFEVVNRGKKGMLGMFNRSRESNEPVSVEHLGDAFLMREGYTLLWIGWQHDVPQSNALMRIYAPTAYGVDGLVRAEFTAPAGTTIIPLGDVGHVPYPVADIQSMSVTVRHDLNGSRTTLARDQWKLEDGRIVLSEPSRTAGIYEAIYRSSDPPVAGVGLAAIRDVVSYVKRDHKYAIGFGISQSAMVLRALLYEGFNQDESGKQVFDGVFAHVAGARRSTFQRFTQPSRTAGPLRNASFSTTEQFPYSDATLRDSATGARDGVLARALTAGVVPKIFYSNSTYEYWGSGASLVHTTPDGTADVPLPASTRLYVFAGGQHGPAAFPPKSNGGQHLPNFNDYRWTMRALLKRLHAWVTLNQAPPDSIYPTISAGTLVGLKQYAFPAIPGVAVPQRPHTPVALDFGPKYPTAGVITQEPPRLGQPYRTLVPQADSDGNDLGGVRMPEIDCAIGTFTGWNLRQPKIGFDTYLLGNTGSYIPFARTAAERATTGDPRRALGERYRDQSEYAACVDARSDKLIAAGLLLPEDKGPIRERAVRHWEWRMQQPAVITSTQRD